ncbi:MAG: MATE family efflux transporter, partial [Pseudomonadota bacterium]
MKGRDLTQGSVPGTLYRLTIPMILSGFAGIGVQFLEIIFIGRLETAQLAAYAFSFPLVFMLMSAGQGVGIGISSVMGRRIGAGDTDHVPRLGTHSFLLSVLIGIGLAIPLWFLLDPIFSLLGASSELRPHLRAYFAYYLPGTTLFFILIGVSSIMRAHGHAAVPGLLM